MPSKPPETDLPPAGATTGLTVRDNLLRIDAALPLVPLEFSGRPHLSQAVPAGSPEVAEVSQMTPPPKGRLAPGGRVPHAARRSSRG
ncbi:MAG: hypothetical protein JNG90_18170 [Planctomycetaceae bacterium]|nr:hypothetical protein [Planctomycetaceae bacterium]